MKRIIAYLLILTACSTPRFEEMVQPLEERLIIIDPGHGGEDQGTETTTKPSYKEKNLTLTTARLVETALKRLGYKVLLTRENDHFLSLKERTSMTNQNQPLLYVSIHFNSAPAQQANGIEVYYYQRNHKRSNESKKLAEDVLNQMITSTGARSRGVKHGNFAVIRDIEVPSILVEGGFLTNADELKKIKDPRYMKKIAHGIAKGIDLFLNP